jgi:hypothetical protein
MALNIFVQYIFVVLLTLPIVITGCGGGGDSGGGGGNNALAPVIIAGTDAFGVSHNPAADWTPQAGPWNAKGARYNPATGKLVFETYRDDIRGGSIRPGSSDPPITAIGVDQYYVASPGTGTWDESGTTVLYVSNADGSSPVCIGCTDVVDGVDGVAVFKVTPSSTATANTVVQQIGATIYANQNVVSRRKLDHRRD